MTADTRFFLLLAVLTSMLGQGAQRHLAWGWIAMAVWSLIRGRSGDDHEARMHRRVGWHYGYGAGYVDGRRGDYRPSTAPPDGRERGSLFDGGPR